MDKISDLGLEEAAQIRRASEEAKASNEMILKWAEQQGRGIIKQMEAKGNQLTLGLHWPKVRQGWLGGFVSGVSAGFQLGYKTAHKLTQGFVNGIEAVVQGTEVEAIQRRNVELKTLLGEAVGEASMCWTNPEGAGTFESSRAEAIVERLYDRFSTPVPTKPEAAKVEEQPRLPGL